MSAVRSLFFALICGRGRRHATVVDYIVIGTLIACMIGAGVMALNKARLPLTTAAGSGESSVRRIIGKKEPLGRTHTLGHNPQRSHSGSCCADGRALWVCKRALWVCNACFF